MDFTHKTQEWYFSDSMTITAKTAVGASSTLKLLREAFKNDFQKRFVSGGGIMRSFAKSRGMTIEAFCHYSVLHPEAEYDKKCDDEIRAYGAQNHTIIEGRLPHVFVPHAFHILLVCELPLRASRRAKDLSGDFMLGDVEQLIEKRDADDLSRYETLYPGAQWPEGDYDLVLDTGLVRAETVLKNILIFHEMWQEKNKARLCHTVVNQNQNQNLNQNGKN